MKQLIPSLLLLFFTACDKSGNDNQYPPDGFVYVHEALPGVTYEIRYFTDNNFIGRPIEGYLAATALLTREAATALRNVQLELEAKGYGIKIFDCYRPQRAVDHFMRWGKDVRDTLRKSEYYPDVDKKDLFALGYLYERSGHTRGSTVDLTVVNRATGEELDMGSTYDFFGDISHHGTPLITPEQEANRNILRDAMVKHGFKILPEEWWHFTLENEPYPDTYFNFTVR